MRLTVAICTHNPDPAKLNRAVGAVAAQLDDVADAEFLVVDNASTPSLREQGLLDATPARIVEEPTPGLTAARDAAIKSARGEILLFVDDDNVLSPGYLRTVIEEFDADPSLGILGGDVEAEYEDAPPAWFLDEFEPWLAVRRREPDERTETLSPPHSKAFPVGAGFALPRDLAAAYFDDAARTARIEGRRAGALSSGEDVDMGLFALSQGRKLVVTGRLHLLHLIPRDRTTPEYLARLAAANVRSCAAIEAKWSQRLSSPIYPAFHRPLARTAVAAAATSILGPFSIHHRIMASWHRSVLRIRLGAMRSPGTYTLRP